MNDKAKIIEAFGAVAALGGMAAIEGEPRRAYRSPYDRAGRKKRNKAAKRSRRRNR